MTQLPPSPFISNSAASPVVADTAVAMRQPPVPATAEPLPASTGGPQEAPASAPTKNPDVGVLGTDHIHEIFAGARKLLPPIDIEEIELPLFIRDGQHLRRWEA